MTVSRATLRVLACLVVAALPAYGHTSRAQVTPAAGYTPPDDTPTIKVGVAIFTDYTYTQEPTKLDLDGNRIHPATFDVSRAYINITGNISHNVSFRITPDINRLTTTTTTTSNLGAGETVSASASTSLDGSLTYRLKYAYGQFNLDEKWNSKGSWVRLGVQQTPYIEWAESVYRYRFQGPILVDRESFLSSSDFGLSTHYNLPGNFGDVHAGYYNGDTYKATDATDQKAIQIRASFRPLPMTGLLKGVRLTAFYDGDNYMQGDARRRFIYAATFEHKYLNAGYEHLDASDQAKASVAETKPRGYTVWATPRSTKGWEGLLRYDYVQKDKDGPAKIRKIAGVAYWFHTQAAPATAALLADVERVNYAPALATDNEKRYALHALFNF